MCVISLEKMSSVRMALTGVMLEPVHSRALSSYRKEDVRNEIYKCYRIIYFYFYYSFVQLLDFWGAVRRGVFQKNKPSGCFSWTEFCTCLGIYLHSILIVFGCLTHFCYCFWLGIFYFPTCFDNIFPCQVKAELAPLSG